MESVERLANAVAQPFSPFLDALAKENSRIPAVRAPKPSRLRPEGPRAALHVERTLRPAPDALWRRFRSSFPRTHQSGSPRSQGPSPSPLGAPLPHWLPCSKICDVCDQLARWSGGQDAVSPADPRFLSSQLCLLPFLLSSLANSPMVRNVLLHDPKKVR